MPLYTYQCKECGDIKEEFRTIATRDDCPGCVCGVHMDFVIMPVNIAPILGGGDFQGYNCPVTDEFVTSRHRRSEIMKEHDLVEKG